MPRRKKVSVPDCGTPPGSRRSQLNSKWSVCPFITAGKMTNSDSSIAMPMATMDRPADSGWFLRVTKTISTNASSGRSRMVNAVLTIPLTLHQIELIYLDGAALAINGDDDGQSNRSLGGSLGDDED